MPAIKHSSSPFIIILGLGFLPVSVQNFLPAGREYVIIPAIRKDVESLKQLLFSLDQPVTCVGWSLGGKFALELFSSYPESFHQLYLLNQAPLWTQKAIQKERNILKENSVTQYLSDFYTRCFHGAPEQRTYFMKSHFKEHTQKFTTLNILQQLDELLNYRLDNYQPLSGKVTFIHSRYDAIAPVSEITRYCQKNALRYHILSKTRSHFPFYSDELWQYLLP